MDSKNVLLAIEERERWKSRRTRLLGKLKEIQNRRKSLEGELSFIQRELATLGEATAHIGRRASTSGSQGGDVIR